MRPESAPGDAAVEAGDHAHAWVAERRDHGSQVIRRNAHIAVGGNQNRKARRAAHGLQRIGARIGPGRLAADQDARLYAWEASGNPASRLQARVVDLPRAEKNFVLRIILLKEAGEVLFQIRLAAMQRLQDADRGMEGARCGVSLAAAKAEDANGNHQAVDGRGGHSKDSQSAQSVEKNGSKGHGSKVDLSAPKFTRDLPKLRKAREKPIRRRAAPCFHYRSRGKNFDAERAQF